MRLSYTKNRENGSAEAISSNDYYPFGLNHINVGGKTGVPPVYSSAVTFENWKYNGKELEETGMYDYGARFYMPDAGIWGQYDPLAEITLQPYAYAYNNPIFYNDPTGMEGEEASSDSGGGGECCSEGDKIEGAKYDGKSYDGGIKSFSVSKDGTQNTEIEGVTVNGNKSSSEWGPSSGSFTLGGGGSKKGFSLSSSLFGLSSKSDWNNYNRSSSAFRKMTAETGADQVANQFYLMFGGMLAAPFAAGAYTALGAYGAVGTYAQGAILRGSIDYSTQALFKGTGNIDYLQLVINTGVGGKIGNLSQGQVFVGNLGLNTANNLGTSAFGGTFSRDITMNAAKTATGALGGAIGMVGGEIVGSLYGNGMDQFFTNANNNYYKK